MKPVAIVILGEASLPIARRIQAVLPAAQIYGLAQRTQGSDVEYKQFGETVRQLFQAGTPIVGLCAAGILIRTLASLLTNKWQEPPVLAIAEDGSAVVPLLGGLQGVNDLARQIATALQVSPAITTTGDRRFQTTLLCPPAGYCLLNPDDAKSFTANVLAGATVRLLGSALWLEQSRLPLSPQGTLTIVVTSDVENALASFQPSSDCLIYQYLGADARQSSGKLVIVGIGPGSIDWLSPEAQKWLQKATDWVGYQTYLDLAEPWRLAHTVCHASDNRAELDRARFALNQAAQGRTVAVISSGDAGIYGMAAAVFEVLEQEAQPIWESVEIQVCPGISAMQAAAAQVGAPLGHDFCVISLSDLLKPWTIIAQRIEAAVQADFAIAFYNPVSQQRFWQLDQARDLLLRWRSPQTPIVLARNLGRVGQTVVVKSLGELASQDVDMRTIVLVGSSQTRRVQQGSQQWVYTPRHYGYPV